MDGKMDRRMAGWNDGWRERRKDKWMDGLF